MQVLILPANEVKVGDIICVPTFNNEYPRGMHCIARVMGIVQPNPHPDITEFKVRLLAHVDGETGETLMGMRHRRKIGVFRKPS